MANHLQQFPQPRARLVRREPRGLDFCDVLTEQRRLDALHHAERIAADVERMDHIVSILNRLAGGDLTRKGLTK